METIELRKEFRNSVKKLAVQMVKNIYLHQEHSHPEDNRTYMLNCQLIEMYPEGHEYVAIHATDDDDIFFTTSNEEYVLFDQLSLDEMSSVAVRLEQYMENKNIPNKGLEDDKTFKNAYNLVFTVTRKGVQRRFAVVLHSRKEYDSFLHDTFQNQGIANLKEYHLNRGTRLGNDIRVISRYDFELNGICWGDANDDRLYTVDVLPSDR